MSNLNITHNLLGIQNNKQYFFFYHMYIDMAFFLISNEEIDFVNNYYDQFLSYGNQCLVIYFFSNILNRSNIWVNYE